MCTRCGDWGTVVVWPARGPGFHVPCPSCRRAEYVAWASGEQGPSVAELEAEAARRARHETPHAEPEAADVRRG